MYQILDPSNHEIRLLRLLPGRPTEKVETQLVIISLQDKPTPTPYEALSYVWGHTSTPPNQITVDGVPKDVTCNLYRALRRLRRATQSRVLWVDAICINQGDVQERNRQVPLMHRIYASATLVLAWLGDSDGGDNRQSTRALGKGSSLEKNSVLDPGVAAIRFLASSLDIHWNDKRFSLVHMLKLSEWLRSDWWSRVWTVQEAAVAPELVYILGAAEIPGETLRGLLASYDQHMIVRQCCDTDRLSGQRHIGVSMDIGSGFQRFLVLRNLDRRRQREKRGGAGLSLSSLASLCRSRNATDPRDKVYAFMGLSQAMESGWVDYNMSLESTYETAARKCIKSTKSLGALSFCHFDRHFQSPGGAGYTEGVSLSLPSWVPNWTLQYDGFTMNRMIFREELLDYWTKCDTVQNWVACGTLSNAVVSDQDPAGYLGVSGICVDTISKIGSPRIQEFTDKTESNVLYSWRLLSEVDRDPMGPYRAGHISRLEAYRRTLCMNTGQASQDGGSWRAATEKDAKLHDMWWFQQMCSFKDAPADIAADFARATRLYQPIMEACTLGRAFFITQRGYFGLAPSGAQVRDRICILQGGRVPYILRESGEAVLPGSGTVRAFELVGDSYVQGLMHGEGMEDVEDGMVSLERWALR